MAKKKRKTKKTRKKKAKKRKLKRKKPKRRKKVKAIDSQELVHKTRVRVIGIGGGGGSIVSEIIPYVSKVDFVIANTDMQALKGVTRRARILAFGQSLTGGLGCGMDAKKGQKAAREEKAKISKLFKGIDLCIIVASLGGGTGSGASPEFAKIARDMGVMTFGIFTMPFKFEGNRRQQIAKNALDKLTLNLNAVSIIPNENIFKIIDKSTPLKESFSAINKRLADNLKGLVEMIYLPGFINIDFADLKTILEGRGKLAYLNSAVALGPNRVDESLKDVLHSPLNEYSIQGAEKIIFNITASQELGMKEVGDISQAISNFNRRAKIIFGVSQDSNYKDKIRISLLAVGCGKEPKKVKPKPKPKPEPKPKPKPKRKSKPKPEPKPQPKPKPKPKPQPKPKPKPEPQPKPKPKPELQPKPKKRKKRKKMAKKNPSSIPIIVKTEKPKTLTRRNALDLKKETEKTEKELFEQERKWDIPAFLRRKSEGSE